MNHLKTRAACVIDCENQFANEDGTTVRGCKKPTMECANGTDGADGDQCAACGSNKCNGDIYPENRLHCWHCAGADCVRPSTAVAVRYPCANYAEYDSCYSIFSYGKFVLTTISIN